MINFFPELNYTEHDINLPFKDAIRSNEEVYQACVSASVNASEIADF
jgi:hypothetical protein